MHIASEYKLPIDIMLRVGVLNFGLKLSLAARVDYIDCNIGKI